VLNKLRRDYKPINGQILIWSNPDTATGGRATAAAAAEGKEKTFYSRTYIVTMEAFLRASGWKRRSTRFSQSGRGPLLGTSPD